MSHGADGPAETDDVLYQFGRSRDNLALDKRAPSFVTTTSDTELAFAQSEDSSILSSFPGFVARKGLERPERISLETAVRPLCVGSL